jgi:ATP-dependent DNA helicase RecG
MPIPDSLVELISRGESEELEFKRGIAERTAAAKTICGMLNGTRGGIVIFGVRDDGSVIGLDVGHETHDRLRGELSKLDPAVTLELETIPIDRDKSLIVIRVPGNTGLYSYDGRHYSRFGASTSQMPESSYQAALLERHHATTRWENQASGSLSINDLDESEILRSIVAAIQNGRLADPGTRDPHALLNGLHLLSDEQPSNAAAVLLARRMYSNDSIPSVDFDWPGSRALQSLNSSTTDSS